MSNVEVGFFSRNSRRLHKMSWVAETLYPDWRQSFRIVRELAHERSEFQDIRIVETGSFGRVLLLDGCVQITEADEFVYQEMITHVPLIQHGRATRVLIIGGGDGGVLRRVLQHRSIERVVMVEVDAAVIRLVREHIPVLSGDAWTDARAEVIVGDGVAYVSEAADASFDVMIVDSTDPIGVGEVLFTDEFYRQCARVLSADGIIVNQCGVPFMQGDELRQNSDRRGRCFAHSAAYVAAVPTYVGGFMTLGIASKSALQGLSEAEVASRASAAGITSTTRYWSPRVHNASFALPPYVERTLEP